MPNWCTNTLKVAGDEEDLKKFLAVATKNPISEEKSDSGNVEYPLLSNLLPLPEDLKNTSSPVIKSNPSLIEKYGADNWYDWQINNWGTKWDVNARLDDDSENEIYFNFDSAWSPPLAWMEKVSEQFPELRFRMNYEEGGMGFAGVASAYAGVMQNAEVEY